jgi:hypothetical protein
MEIPLEKQIIRQVLEKDTRHSVRDERMLPEYFAIRLKAQQYVFFPIERNNSFLPSPFGAQPNPPVGRGMAVVLLPWKHSPCQRNGQVQEGGDEWTRPH